MQITDELARSGGFTSLARELGVSEEQAARGAEALLPSIPGGMEKHDILGGRGR